MIILVGKTCSGKSTIADIMENDYYLPRIRTYTTRPKRQNEGEEYHFINKEEFEDLKEKGFFFETTQYEVASGETWHYGTAKEDLQSFGVIVMNLEGAKKIRHMADDSINPTIVYLNVSEGVAWDRLRKRGQNSDEAQRRIKADNQDFADIDKYYDYAITTDKLSAKDIARKIMCLRW